MSDIPDWLNKKVTSELHKQGIELTPDQVIAERKSAYAKIRASCKARGIECPEGDLELLEWMRILGVNFKGK